MSEKLGPTNIQQLNIHQRILGGVNVTFAEVEHNASKETYPWDDIREVVRSSPRITKIVSQYFLPELEKTVFNKPHPIGTQARNHANVKGIISFSQGLEEIVHQANKNVLVMDPANSAMYELHETELPWFISGAGAVSIASSVAMSRRRALLALTLGGSAIAAGAQSIHPDAFAEGGRTLNARDARRYTISKGLWQYGKTHEDEDLVLFYPKKHVNALLYYVDHLDQPNALKRTVYKLMIGVTMAIREYQPDQAAGSWTKINSTQIK